MITVFVATPIRLKQHSHITKWYIKEKCIDIPIILARTHAYVMMYTSVKFSTNFAILGNLSPNLITKLSRHMWSQLGDSWLILWNSHQIYYWQKLWIFYNQTRILHLVFTGIICWFFLKKTRNRKATFSSWYRMEVLFKISNQIQICTF